MRKISTYGYSSPAFSLAAAASAGFGWPVWLMAGLAVVGGCLGLMAGRDDE
ncbi:hypothetical protein [Bifidobacterium actinocoloniiforme]|uniref:hypothetical protein n=1 Tax=Bifidobacterium actinocoloniiforme TaxID=638619 RepID=UPI000ABD9A15|nr:hypothetical protein [Bifidobacterium actinocoloniiforme]